MEEAPTMPLNRIYVGEEIDLRLRNLKARTGLTPNLLCRLGFCLSLAEPGVPDPRLYADGQARKSSIAIHSLASGIYSFFRSYVNGCYKTIWIQSLTLSHSSRPI